MISTILLGRKMHFQYFLLGQSELEMDTERFDNGVFALGSLIGEVTENRSCMFQ